jgi:protein phosphatase
MRKAGNDIYEHAERNEIPARMATTMVAANIRNGVLTVANVGDSRAYLVRGGGARQLTRDHNIVGEMVRDGEIDEEEALRVKGKNRLMRSLGGERDVQVDIFQEALQPSDRILLCTDGLTRYVVSNDIAKLTSEGTPTEIAQRCIDYANQQGGVDNVTVAVIEVGEPVTEAVASVVGTSVAPKPVDWDEMVTQPSVRPIKRRAHRRHFTRQQQVMLGVAGMIALIAMGGAMIAILSPGTDSPADIGPKTPSPAVAATASATPTAAPTRTQTPTLPAMPTLSPPSIMVGERVIVTEPLGIKLRAQPSLAGVQISIVISGSVLEVIGGPSEAGDYVWWQLRTEDGTTGWAADENFRPIPSPTPAESPVATPTATPTPTSTATSIPTETPTPTETSTPTNTSVPASVQGPFKIGGYVNVTDPQGAPYWNQPSQKGNQSPGTFLVGTRLKVVQGPKISEDLTWWQVRDESTELTGWLIQQ